MGMDRHERGLGCINCIIIGVELYFMRVLDACYLYLYLLNARETKSIILIPRDSHKKVDCYIKLVNWIRKTKFPIRAEQADQIGRAHV